MERMGQTHETMVIEMGKKKQKERLMIEKLDAINSCITMLSAVNSGEDSLREIYQAINQLDEAKRKLIIELYDLGVLTIADKEPETSGLGSLFG